VSGLTLVGGHGWLSRRYGLFADHVVGAEMIDANGDLLLLSKDSNADLYDFNSYNDTKSNCMNLCFLFFFSGYGWREEEEV
jgi:hypothetical protein